MISSLSAAQSIIPFQQYSIETPVCCFPFQQQHHLLQYTQRIQDTIVVGSTLAETLVFSETWSILNKPATRDQFHTKHSYERKRMPKSSNVFPSSNNTILQDTNITWYSTHRESVDIWLSTSLWKKRAQALNNWRRDQLLDRDQTPWQWSFNALKTQSIFDTQQACKR